MDTHGVADHLRRALAGLVAALCASDVRAIEEATRRAEEALHQQSQSGDGIGRETALQLRSLTQSAQSLVWTQLLTLWAQGAQSPNALLREAA